MSTAPGPPMMRDGEGPTMLSPLDPGHIPPSRERARREALREMLADLPSPAQLIWHLPSEIVEALSGAWRSRTPGTAGAWRIDAAIAPELARWGLCEVRGVCLTNYGAAVMHALREAEQ